ncbi:unnamed protein product [Arctogadus glacialis]
MPSFSPDMQISTTRGFIVVSERFTFSAKRKNGLTAIRARRTALAWSPRPPRPTSGAGSRRKLQAVPAARPPRRAAGEPLNRGPLNGGPPDPELGAQTLSWGPRP